MTEWQSATRLGLVGAGVIGKRHLQAIAASDVAELVAITDTSSAAEKLAADCGAEFYSATSDMLNEANVEGVIIATPTEHHFAPTAQALESGAHVLVEKPIMPTLAQAEEIIGLSAKTGMQVLVGHHRRYYSQVHKAREIVQSGVLGKLIAINGQWNMRKHESYYSQAWRQQWEAGPVLTNLIHELDSLRYICGEIESLSAEKSHIQFGFEKEDAAAMVMRFESGALGTFILSDQSTSPWSWECATGENPAFPRSAQNAIRFMGSQASLEFPNLVLWHHGKQTPDWNHALTPEEIPSPTQDAYVSQIEHFCAVIRNEEPPRITALDATNTLRATLAVFESANSGERVMLGAAAGD